MGFDGLEQEIASGIVNDSTVSGDTVSDALDTLSSAITAEDIWNRTGTTIEPKVANDNVTIGSGIYTGAGLIGAYLKPSSDGITSIQLQKSDGTSILNVDTTNSRVGIGTTTPSTLLEVGDGTNFVKELSINAGTDAYLYYKKGGVIAWTAGNDTAPNGDYFISTGAGVGGKKLVILPNGNVGIGTTSPDSLIESEKDTADASLLRLTRNLSNYVDFLSPAGYDGAGGALSIEATGTPSMEIITAAGGNYATGDIALRKSLFVCGRYIACPSSDQSLSAGDSLTATNEIMRVVGNGGAVTLTSTPNIVDGVDGQIVIIQGTSDTNTVEFQDESNLANSGLQLSGGNNIILGQGDTLQLMYDSGDDKWYEISRSDN